MTMAAIDFQTLANAGFPPASFKPGEIIFSAGDKGDNATRRGKRLGADTASRCRRLVDAGAAVAREGAPGH